MFLSFALLLMSTIMYAQTEISGTVVDATGIGHRRHSEGERNIKRYCD